MFFPHPRSETEQADNAQFYQHILHQTIELGAEIARHLHADITRFETRDRIPGVVEDFERITRGIRRAILLALKVAEPPPAPPIAASTNAAPPGQRAPRPDRLDADPSEPRTDALPTDHLDRLDRDEDRPEDHDDDRPEDCPGNRPIPDILNDIVADFGPHISPELAQDLSRIRHADEPGTPEAEARIPTPAHEHAQREPSATPANLRSPARFKFIRPPPSDTS